MAAAKKKPRNPFRTPDIQSEMEKKGYKRTSFGVYTKPKTKPTKRSGR